MFVAMNDMHRGEFISGVTTNGNAIPFAGTLYIYYVAKAYENEVATAGAMLDALLDFEKLAPTDPEIADFIVIQEYLAMKANLQQLVADGGILADTEIVNNVKNTSNTLFKDVMLSGLNAVNATAETIAECTSDDVTLPLIDFVSYTMFGSELEEVDIFNIESDNKNGSNFS